MASSMVMKAEGFLRLAAVILAVATATIIGTDTQTKNIFFLERKANPKDLTALFVAVIVYSIAAGYNLLQLCMLFLFGWYKGNQTSSNKLLAWVCFLCDQTMAYMTFATNIAATQASSLAVTGQNEFQWLKLCNIYGRFCLQIGGGLLCGILTTFLMAVISSISAFTVFRRNSSKVPSTRGSQGKGGHVYCFRT